MERKKLGNEAEELARRKLISQNYQIIERNFTCKIGEIDIIAKDGDTIVFVEVRSRKNCNYGSPQETVNLKKQRKLRNLAQYYLKINNLMDADCRFDVVAIVVEPQLNIEIIRDAF
ncbi:MAG: putative endonuclease [Clostridia bacterium]|nr:putative endonuclease [Clostridia bacterium]